MITKCYECMFCEELTADVVRCSNADVAGEAEWEKLYLMQGYLELPIPESQDTQCFWFVPKQ